MDFSKVPLEGGTELWEAHVGNRQYRIRQMLGGFWRLAIGVNGEWFSSFGNAVSFDEAVAIAEACEGVRQQHGV